MKNVIANYVDDFLDGSITQYNYNPVMTKHYLLYCQIAGFQKTGEKYYNELQNHSTYMINLTTKGKGKINIDGEETVVEAGDIIFLHNFNHHIMKKIPGEDWEFYFLHVFESPLLGFMYQEFLKGKHYILKGMDIAFYSPIFERIIYWLSTKSKYYENEISQEIYHLILDLLTKVPHKETLQVSNSIADVVLYVQKHFADDITVSDIIKVSSYSKNHLERIFKKEMKMTINDYLSLLRLRRAQELLIETNKSFKEISYEVGLKEYRMLHYLFKKTLNCTPGEYRKSKGVTKRKTNYAK